MKKLICLGLIGLIAVSVTGCATSPRASVMSAPARGQSYEQTMRDQAECEQQAKQWENTANSAAVSGGVGALIGAIVGGALGAAVGIASPRDAGRLAATGAAMGAVIGGSQSAAAGAGADIDRVNRAYAVCLESRGYLVR